MCYADGMLSTEKHSCSKYVVVCFYQNVVGNNPLMGPLISILDTIVIICPGFNARQDISLQPATECRKAMSSVLSVCSLGGVLI